METIVNKMMWCEWLVGIRLWSGRGSVYDYQSVLRQVRYVNTNNAHATNRRTFVLSCTEAGKHVASNLLAVNVRQARFPFKRKRLRLNGNRA